jgi:chemotaxis protein methyltransferase CheR
MQPLKDLLKRNDAVRGVLGTRTYHAMRQRPVLLLSPRRPSYAFTQFLRAPTQFEALVGPVLDCLRKDDEKKPITITVIGSSIGCEPYSIASVIARRRPDVEFRIHAFDNNPEMVERTRRAQYTAEEVWTHAGVTRDFVAATFTVDHGRYTVRPELVDRVQVSLGDILDAGITAAAGRSDIVFAQNLLFNLRPQVARRAFPNICSLLNARSVLFIDGMDLGMRQRLTRRAGLLPLLYEIGAIHEEARRERGSWHGRYWGLEPFSDSRKGWARRYGTIFVKGTAVPKEHVPSIDDSTRPTRPTHPPPKSRTGRRLPQRA